MGGLHAVPQDLQPHLCQCGVQLEYLAFPFHLPHTDLAGKLRGGQAVPLQGEGAMQGLLAATPNVIEGDLLGKEGNQGRGGEASLPWPRGTEAEAGSGDCVRAGWGL